MTGRTPVAIFAYNRPAHVQRLFQSLAACERLDECEIVVYCDGAKGAADREQVAASRRAVRTWVDRLNARVVEQSANQGLARSIVTGVTELCRDYGRTIVLEDDLVVSPDFLDFMLSALRRYECDSRVFQISGYMFPVDHPARPDAMLLPYTTTWGWATWDRAWRAFRWEADDAVSYLADAAARRKFDHDGAFPFSRMLEARLTGRNDSWGILWKWIVFSLNGLVVHPRVSLVWNGGFDGSGIHCAESHLFDEAPLETFARRKLPPPISFPESVEVDGAAYQRVNRELRAASLRFERSGAPPARWRALCGRIGRALKRGP